MYIEKCYRNIIQIRFLLKFNKFHHVFRQALNGVYVRYKPIHVYYKSLDFIQESSGTSDRFLKPWRERWFNKWGMILSKTCCFIFRNWTVLEMYWNEVFYLLCAVRLYSCLVVTTYVTVDRWLSFCRHCRFSFYSFR